MNRWPLVEPALVERFNEMRADEQRRREKLEFSFTLSLLLLLLGKPRKRNGKSGRRKR